MNHMVESFVRIGECGELWESDKVTRKVEQLPPVLQGPFLRGATELAEQETDTMLRFIQESRMALRLTSLEIQEEQEALQRTSRFMAQSNFEENDKMGARPPTRSDMSAYKQRRREQANQKAAVERYIRKRELERERTRMRYMDDGGFGIDTDMPAAPMSPDLYQEEAQEALKGMRISSARIENERSRQGELVRQRKEKKKAKQAEKEEKAIELLEQANNMEDTKKRDKERQAEKVKELLEEKKRKRENTMLSLGSHADTFLASDFRPDSSASGRLDLETSVAPTDDTGKKDKKKKDKKRDKDKKKDKKKKEKEADMVLDMV